MHNTNLILLTFFLLLACSAPENKPSGKQKTPDAAAATSILDMEKVKKEFIASYAQDVKFDSSFATPNNKSFQIYTRLYCNYDSAINVPAKYLLNLTDSIFITHSFSYSITLKSGDSVLLDHIFNVKDFAVTLDKPLLSYGILLGPEKPEMDTEGVFHFPLSISIPLTDIGVRREIRVKVDGSYSVAE